MSSPRSVRETTLAALLCAVGMSCACGGSSARPARSPRPAARTEIAERVDASQLDAVIDLHRDELADCLFASPETYAAVQFLVAGNGRLVSVTVNGDEGGELAGCIRAVLAPLDFPRSRTLQTKGSFEMAR